MSIRIGLYDFFAYTLPGGIHLLVLLYLVRKYLGFPIDYTNPSITQIAIFIGLSYLAGHIVDPIVLRSWYSLFRPKDLFERTLTDFNKRNSRIQVQSQDMDWYILFSYVKRLNLEMARDVEQFNVVQIMLRNVSFGFLIIAILAVIEFAQHSYVWWYAALATLCLIISIAAARRAVKFNIWFYISIFQSVAALILEPSQLPVKVIETTSQKPAVATQSQDEVRESV